VIPWVTLGIGFYSLFRIAWMQRCLSGQTDFLRRRGVSLITYHLLGPPAVCSLFLHSPPPMVALMA
jgi:hypothetical protein